MKNSKLLIVLLSVLLVSISGCDDSIKVPGDDGELTVTVYRVQGEGLECVNMHYRLSCNWEKYNKLKKAN